MDDLFRPGEQDWVPLVAGDFSVGSNDDFSVGSCPCLDAPRAAACMAMDFNL